MQDTLIHLTPSAFATALVLAAFGGALAALVLAMALSERTRARMREVADPALIGAFDEHGRKHRRRQDDQAARHAANSIDRFYVALLSGQIDGVKPAPCRYQDLHELYVLWCGRHGEHALAGWHFATVLRQDHGVTMSHSRFMDDAGTVHPPVSVLWLSDKSQIEQAEPWIGTQLQAMADAVARYRIASARTAPSDQVGVLRHQAAVSRSARS